MEHRSFLFIDDCIDAVMKLFIQFSHPINIGSDEKVTINQLISIAEECSKKIQKNYQLDKPQGVKGRSSNNDLIKELGWDYKYSLKDGIKKTYEWIEQIYINKKNDEYVRFTRKTLIINEL